jgi:hypothetical protein
MLSENDWSADNQQETDISDQYFLGFVEGEGCFYVGFSRRKDLPLGWQVITEFHLSQNPSGKNILNAFRKRLGCGYIKPNHRKNHKDKTWVLIVKDRNDLDDKLIPFFKKNPLKTRKREDFDIFVKTLDLIREKKHLSEEGLKIIVKLVYSSLRITNKRYSKEEILGSSETIRKSRLRRQDIVRTQ